MIALVRAPVEWLAGLGIVILFFMVPFIPMFLYLLYDMTFRALAG